MDKKVCSIEGCNSTSKRIVKGYCLMHYERQRSKGALGPSVKFKDANGECVIAGCTTYAGPTGACRKHWHNVNSPLKSRKRRLKIKGLTLESYEVVLASQNFGCKICGAKAPGHGRKNFAIDHDHSCCPGDSTCGTCFRGLLCIRCNLALGEVNDDRTLLQSMIDYLTEPTPLYRPADY
jgi:hypothetical protein